MINGLGPKAKLVSVAPLTGDVADFEIKEHPAGSGKFRLYVKESGVGELDDGATVSAAQPHLSLVNIGAALTFDADPTVDSDDDADTDADQNIDATIMIDGGIGVRSALAFTNTLGEVSPDADETDGTANTAGFHFAFTIPDNVEANTPIGYFETTGHILLGPGADVADTDDDIPAEYLDGIITGSARSLFDVRDSDMTLVYSGNGALEVGTYELDLTVSGDGGHGEQDDYWEGAGNCYRVEPGA